MNRWQEALARLAWLEGAPLEDVTLPGYGPEDTDGWDSRPLVWARGQWRRVDTVQPAGDLL